MSAAPKLDQSLNPVILSAGLTDVGVKRDHNEDMLLMLPEKGIYIVCDGMGGHAAGEVASELAANTVAEYLQDEYHIINGFNKNPNNENRDEVISLINEAIGAANSKVREVAMDDVSKQGMGTTIVMSVVCNSGTFIAHVGDSRAYLYRKGEVHQVTDDHSYVNSMVKKGILTVEQAEKHPHGNVITQAIGVQQFVEPDVTFFETEYGDQFVLCSDGLSGYTNKKQFQKFWSCHPVNELPKVLIEHANLSGGKDNITAIAIHIGEEDAPPEHPENVTISRKVAVLKEVPLFRELDFNQIARLLEIIKVKKFKEGDIIVKEGNPGNEMFVMLVGSAKVYVGTREIFQLNTGGHFGEMALIDSSPRSATVRVGEDSKLLSLNGKELLDLFKKYPDLGTKLSWSLLNNMNIRLREANDLIKDLNNQGKVSNNVSDKMIADK